MFLRELRDRRDIRLLNVLIARYHKQGNKPGLSKSRYFTAVEVEDGVEYWIAGAVLQDPSAFAPLFRKFNLDSKRSYFLRRIARFTPKQCGDILVEFLHLLAERLRGEGKELLVTLGLEDHSNKLYKLAGFEEIGRSSRGKPVFVLRLQ